MRYQNDTEWIPIDRVHFSFVSFLFAGDNLGPKASLSFVFPNVCEPFQMLSDPKAPAISDARYDRYVPNRHIRAEFFEIQAHNGAIRAITSTIMHIQAESGTKEAKISQISPIMGYFRRN